MSFLHLILVIAEFMWVEVKSPRNSRQQAMNIPRLGTHYKLSNCIIVSDTLAALYLYHVAIPTDVSLLSLSGGRRQSRAAGLQGITTLYRIDYITALYDSLKCKTVCSHFSCNERYALLKLSHRRKLLVYQYHLVKCSSFWVTFKN